jgi:hypothetical protein
LSWATLFSDYEASAATAKNAAEEGALAEAVGHRSDENREARWKFRPKYAVVRYI